MGFSRIAGGPYPQEHGFHNSVHACSGIDKDTSVTLGPHHHHHHLRSNFGSSVFDNSLQRFSGLGRCPGDILIKRSDTAPLTSSGQSVCNAMFRSLLVCVMWFGAVSSQLASVPSRVSDGALVNPAKVGDALGRLWAGSPFFLDFPMLSVSLWRVPASLMLLPRGLKEMAVMGAWLLGWLRRWICRRISWRWCPSSCSLGADLLCRFSVLLLGCECCDA